MRPQELAHKDRTPELTEAENRIGNVASFLTRGRCPRAPGIYRLPARMLVCQRLHECELSSGDGFFDIASAVNPSWSHSNDD
jgi:hypothetical protein